MKPDTGRRAVQVAAALFVLLFSVYVLTMGGHTYAQDDESFLFVTESIVTRGDFDIPPPGDYPTVGGHHGREGRVYAQSSVGQPLATIPLYLAGQAVAQWLDPSFLWYFTRLITNLFNPLVSAGLGVVLYAYARALGYRVRTSAALALIWAFATLAWVEAKTIYNEPLMGLCLLLAFYFIKRGDKAWQWQSFSLAGVFWGLASATRIHAAIALPALLVYLIWLWLARRADIPLWRGTRSLISSLIAFAVPGLIIIGIFAVGYNLVRFGDPLEFGYGETLVQIPILQGIVGMLFSPGKSIFLFAVPVLVGFIALPWFARAHLAETLAYLVYFIVVVLFHARYNNWHSAGAWGDRYLYAAIPLFVLPIGAFLESRMFWARALTAVGVAAGLLVTLLAVPINFDVYINTNLNEPRRLWEPASSPVLAQVGLLSERAQTWWHQVRMPQNGFILTNGWLTSDAVEGEIFPRYIAQRAGLGIVAEPEQTVRVRAEVVDYRPAGKPARELTFYSNGEPISAGQMASGGAMNYAFELPVPHPREQWLELRTVGTDAVGDSPMGDELGFQVRDIVVTADDEPLDAYPDLSIPPIPLAIPNARWSWFYNPKLPHWDFWWWYLYYSGLPSTTVWTLAAPLLLSGLAGTVGGGIWLVILLRHED